MYKYKCYTYDIHLDIRYVFDKYIIKYIFLFDFYLDKNDFHFRLLTEKRYFYKQIVLHF